MVPITLSIIQCVLKPTKLSSNQRTADLGWEHSRNSSYYWVYLRSVVSVTKIWLYKYLLFAQQTNSKNTSTELSASSKLPPIELRLRLRLVNALFSLSCVVTSTSVAPVNSQSERLSSDKILHEVTTLTIGCWNS